MEVPRAPESEVLFGRLLVEQGIAKAEHVDECLNLLADLYCRGVAPLPRLGALLVKRGYLPPQPSEAPPASRQETTKILPRSLDPSLPPEVSQAAADPKNVLGKYVRVTRIGSGGMGEVWHAWDREIGRWVALKVLMYDKPDELARFKREAQTAGKLTHPNIAAIYEVGEAQGRPFIAMQYVEGQTLASFPKGDTRNLVEAVAQAALAAHYAHEHGVIHRDLKPANIMACWGERRPPATRRLPGGRPRPSSPLQVYVMDFGLAKARNVDSSLSASGSIVGTPVYMSPEQARGAPDLDPRADVYSLGATLYELLADRQVFIDSDVYALLKKIVEEEPVPIRKLRPRINTDLETIVMKCLEKDRRRRYATALELAEDLLRWLDGEAILAHPPSYSYRARKGMAQHRGFTAMVAVALLAVLALAGYWGALQKEARGWVQEAGTKAAAGEYEEAKRLLDQARTRIAADEALYRLCEQKIAEERDLSLRKRREDEVFGPIFRNLEKLPEGADGWKRGIELLDEGIARFGDSWDAWMRKGQFHEKLEDIDGALKAYERAYGLNPLLRAEAAVGRGKDFQAKGNLEAAIAEYDDALKINPKHVEAHASRGQARRARGDLQGAAADFEKALQLAPAEWPHRKGVEESLAQIRAPRNP